MFRLTRSLANRRCISAIEQLDIQKFDVSVKILKKKNVSKCKNAVELKKVDIEREKIYTPTEGVILCSIPAITVGISVVLPPKILLTSIIQGSLIIYHLKYPIKYFSSPSREDIDEKLKIITYFQEKLNEKN